MSLNYVLCCESTADLTEEYLRERDIPFACFRFHMDGRDYKDDYGRSMPAEDFYERLRKGSVSQTSQVPAADYESLWRPYLEKDMDIVHITLSEGISGTYNSACLAAKLMQEEFPGRSICVINSENASSGYGLIVSLAADRRDEGADFLSLTDYIKDIRGHVQAWFFTSDLSHLCRGGRISKTACAFGTALKICPVMTVNKEGKLEVVLKCRGKKKAMEACIGKMLENCAEGSSYSGYFYICHSDCIDDALLMRDMAEARFKGLEGKTQIFNIGAVIGSHTGPGTIGIFFNGKEKER